MLVRNAGTWATWAAMAAIGAWVAWSYQGSRLQNLRVQHAQQMQRVAENTAAAQQAWNNYLKAVQETTANHIQETAQNDKETNASLDRVQHAAAGERTQRMRDSAELAHFIERHRHMVERGAAAEQRAATAEHTARVLAELFGEADATSGELAQHADQLHARLAGCERWADATARAVNTGPQPIAGGQN